MALDEEQHGFPVGFGKSETFEAAFRNRQAFRNVILDRHGFPRIMKQDRQVEQFGLIQFIEDSRVAFIPFGLGLAQGVQVFNGLQRVFIHRKAMRNIADGQRVNALKFRQEQGQQMKRVHGAQGVCRMQFRQYILKEVPQGASLGQPARQNWPGLFQLMFGRGTEFETALRDQAKRAEE